MRFFDVREQKVVGFLDKDNYSVTGYLKTYLEKVEKEGYFRIRTGQKSGGVITEGWKNIPIDSPNALHLLLIDLEKLGIVLCR